MEPIGEHDFRSKRLIGMFGATERAELLLGNLQTQCPGEGISIADIVFGWLLNNEWKIRKVFEMNKNKVRYEDA